MKQKLFSSVNEGFVQTAPLTLKKYPMSQRYATAAPFTARSTLHTAHIPAEHIWRRHSPQPRLSGNQPHIQMCLPGSESEYRFISY